MDVVCVCKWSKGLKSLLRPIPFENFEHYSQILNEKSLSIEYS